MSRTDYAFTLLGEGMLDLSTSAVDQFSADSASFLYWPVARQAMPVVPGSRGIDAIHFHVARSGAATQSDNLAGDESLATADTELDPNADTPVDESQVV
jgi:hypothetical protein